MERGVSEEKREGQVWKGEGEGKWESRSRRGGYHPETIY